MFAERCEAAIQRNSLPSYLKDLQTQLDSYTSMNMTSSAESPIVRLKLKALIMDTIYNISVLEDLIEEKIKTKDDWLWQKHLRYFKNAHHTIVAAENFTVAVFVCLFQIALALKIYMFLYRIKKNLYHTFVFESILLILK